VVKVVGAFEDNKDKRDTFTIFGGQYEPEDGIHPEGAPERENIRSAYLHRTIHLFSEYLIFHVDLYAHVFP